MQAIAGRTLTNRHKYPCDFCEGHDEDCLVRAPLYWTQHHPPGERDVAITSCLCCKKKRYQCTSRSHSIDLDILMDLGAGSDASIDGSTDSSDTPSFSQYVQRRKREREQEGASSSQLHSAQHPVAHQGWADERNSNNAEHRAEFRDILSREENANLTGDRSINSPAAPAPAATDADDSDLTSLWSEREAETVPAEDHNVTITDRETIDAPIIDRRLRSSEGESAIEECRLTPGLQSVRVISSWEADSVHRVSVHRGETVDVLFTDLEWIWAYVMDKHGLVGYVPAEVLDLDLCRDRDRVGFNNGSTLLERMQDVASDEELAGVRHERRTQIRLELSETAKLRKANARLRAKIEDANGSGELVKRGEQARQYLQTQLDSRTEEIATLKAALRVEKMRNGERQDHSVELAAAKRDSEEKGVELRRLRVGMNILHKKLNKANGVTGRRIEEEMDEGWASSEDDG